MRRILILTICCGMTLAGCKNKKDSPEGAEKSETTSNLVEMGVSAQKHIGMQVAAAEVSQLNQYLRTTGPFNPSIAGLVSSLPLRMDGL